MRTLGVDLASKAPNTAVVAIEWPDGEPPRPVDTGAGPFDDDALISLFSSGGYEPIAIDAPLGWPDRMVDLLTAWRSLEQVHLPARERAFGKEAIHRRTDRDVHEQTTLWPIPVGVNTLGWVSLRAIHLLSESGFTGDRDGVDAKFLETYPKAVARHWFGDQGLAAKKDPAARSSVLNRIEEDLELDFGVQRDEITSTGESNHAFDALMCALAARAAALGETRCPPAEHREQAKREGWIHLPECPLHNLR